MRCHERSCRMVSSRRTPTDSCPMLLACRGRMIDVLLQCSRAPEGYRKGRSLSGHSDSPIGLVLDAQRSPARKFANCKTDKRL